jgi:hypothetical protein
LSGHLPGSIVCPLERTGLLHPALSLEAAKARWMRARLWLFVIVDLMRFVFGL